MLALVAVLAIATALWRLEATTAGLRIEAVRIGETPATVYRPSSGEPGPVVVIAHGFAGSQRLMQPFAVTFARNGYTAVTFDFLGHGRNPRPLTGSITEPDGATRALIEQTASVTAFARRLGDGRLAVLGHSMASDIVVRVAQADPGIAATIAVSMFSPVVTPTSPRDLLVLVGDWEDGLKREALRVVGQVAAPAAARERVTYGTFADGTARRTAFADGVEHIGVLYSRESMDEALSWLDASFTRPPEIDRYLDARGPWIMLLLAGIVLLGKPLSKLLPVVSAQPTGAGLGWRAAWPAVAGPAIATPVILRFIPTDFLPVVVGDYLAAHFALYGLLVGFGLWWVRSPGARTDAAVSNWPVGLLIASLMVGVYGLLGLGFAIDAFVTSFAASAERIPLILAMLVGTLSYFLTNDWLTRGQGAGRGLHAASQIAFLVSLALAVALDLQRLFFLLVIVPAIVLFLVIGSLFSNWAYGRTGHPFVAALGNAVLFAWALGVTFPMLAG